MNLAANLHDAPAAALWPGLAGLLPFLACALLPLATDATWHPLQQQALVAYGALILTFVGAIHWGIALMVPRQPAAGACFAWSVVPALWGWLALFPSFVVSLALLGAGFIVQLAVDYRVAAVFGLPAWYLALRSLLTSGVLLSLLLASLAAALAG
ncbi:MAG: DUF3429 domain-containing protein [Pseudomonadota bacterium]